MKFWQALSFTGTDQLVPLARSCEEAGFQGVFLSDHVFVPARLDSKYPYSPDGSPPFTPATEHPELLEQAFSEPLITTLGDVNGDNVEDIIAFTSGKVTLLSLGKPVQEFAVPGLGTPARAVLLHFTGGAQVILGDEQGGLASLALDGSLRWAGQLSSGDIIRGLDDARVGGQAFLAAANHNGAVALFDEAGTARWQYAMPGTVRRLRSYDLNGEWHQRTAIGWGRRRIYHAQRRLR